ncbi:anhydro-N-acetylmuramic acid kinase [Prochlorococcus sp. MIT 1300]|uniref:anhydro-N-acetylmuramic acid kinase n=1 Tax=Prochlorococcus sp. MIT 1300 TaxID=3096218 RepID=UPI002A747ADE|nr:anhydro-N-acetylmuramic acid kinase [Prochlorococcus sp. MIT 1300]
MHVLGLMSGTSADGVDAVLAYFSGSPARPNWEILDFAFTSYPASLRKTIVEVGQGQRLSSSDWLELSEAVTEVQANAADKCASRSNYELVGCHGQTVWHRPPGESSRGASLQILHAQLLAQLLNKAVVYDFRSADMVLGGQGAPLVPKADEALLGRGQFWRGILNLGGISNLTLIPPCTGPDCRASVMGWDCGPANSLIDLAVQYFTNGDLEFDRDALIASKGIVHEELIEKWLLEPFFQQLPPKSTGREKFGVLDLRERLGRNLSIGKEDLIATLTAFTAAIVAQDLNRWAIRNFVRPNEMLISGGGRRNPILLHQLRRRCLGTRIRPIEEFGIPSTAREALAFALLAWWHMLKYEGNLASVTGASRSAVLGIRVNPV